MLKLISKTKPASGNDIDAMVADYLAKGGTITQCRAGIARGHLPIPHKAKTVTPPSKPEMKEAA